MNFLTSFAPFLYDCVLPICIGYFLVNIIKIKRDALDILFKFGIWVVASLVALFSVWVIKIDMGLIWLPVSGLLMQVIPLLIGRWRMKRYSDFTYADKGSYLLSMTLFNAAILGKVAVFFLFGEIAYGYAEIILTLGNIYIYGYAFPLAARYQQLNEGQEVKKWNLKSLLTLNQLPLAFTILAVILNVSGIARPAFASRMIKPLVHISAWCSALPIGATIHFKTMRKYLFVGRDVAVTKFLVVPAIIMLLSLIFIKDSLILKTLLVISASSGPMVAIMLSKLHKLNTDMAMSSFILTTAMYLVILVPVFILVFQHIWV